MATTHREVIHTQAHSPAQRVAKLSMAAVGGAIIAEDQNVQTIEQNKLYMYASMVDATESGGAFAVLAFAPELKLCQTTYQEPLVWVPRGE